MGPDDVCKPYVPPPLADSTIAECFDAAVLDINVRGERIDPIADLLAARGIPMLFATGYGMAAVAERRNASVIDKPYTQDRLASALARAMATPKAVGPAA